MASVQKKESLKIVSIKRRVYEGLKIPMKSRMRSKIMLVVKKMRKEKVQQTIQQRK